MTEDLKIIHWCKFTEYHKVCDKLGMNGACYSLVFNEEKPSKYQRPSEFENCVYIGESAGYYIDKQSGMKTKRRSHLHKRMTHHIGPLINGKGEASTSHKMIIETWGQGKSVFDGTLTGCPCWLGLMIPRDDMVDPEACKAWCQYVERQELYHYIQRWGSHPIGNLDAKSERNPESFSTIALNNTVELPFA